MRVNIAAIFSVGRKPDRWRAECFETRRYAPLLSMRCHMRHRLSDEQQHNRLILRSAPELVEGARLEG